MLFTMARATPLGQRSGLRPPGSSAAVRVEEPAARRDLLATVLESATVHRGRVSPTFRPVWRVIAQVAVEETPSLTLDQLRRL